MQLKPVKTEKAMHLAASGRYTFAVDRLATKTDVKQQVEKLFAVKVTKVQTAIRPGHSYRTGRKNLRSTRPERKFAMVTVRSGQKIDLFAAN